MKRLMVVMTLIVCFAMGSQAEPANHISIMSERKLIVDNIYRCLKLINFPATEIDIESVNVATGSFFTTSSRSLNGKIIDILEKNRQTWIRSNFLIGKLHKNAVASWRYNKNPSIQFTKIMQKNGEFVLEIDIDRWLLRWKKPWDALRHIAVEIVAQKITFGSTNQERISHLLDEWEARESRIHIATKS